LRYRHPYLKTKGYYRRKCATTFQKKDTTRRFIVETINLVEKRKFGDEPRSRLLKRRYIDYAVSSGRISTEPDEYEFSRERLRSLQTSFSS